KLAIAGEVAAQIATSETAAEPATTATKKGKDGEKADSETTSAQGRLLGMLRNAGLLIRFRDDRYQFRQSGMAAYLASLSLKNASADILNTKAAQHSWSEAIAYAGLTRSLDALVMKRMKAQTDLLQENVVEMARWL